MAEFVDIDVLLDELAAKQADNEKIAYLKEVVLPVLISFDPVTRDLKLTRISEILGVTLKSVRALMDFYADAKLDGEETDLLKKAILTLAGQCDGAKSKDGVGFNKYDQEFGHQLANYITEGKELSETLRKQAVKLVKKYPRQLFLAGIDVGNIETAEAEKVKAEKAEKSSDDKPELIPTAILPDLVDVVERNGTPAFLLLKDGELVVETAIPGEGNVAFVPPDKDKTPWLLAKAEEVMRYYTEDTDAAVYDALLEYYKTISELPTEKHYDLLATWTMHTYLMEKNQYSPYLWFYAVYERGKTRTGKALIYAAYRGVHVESLRDAYIVRVANDWQATLFFDVINLWQKAEKAGTEDVLMSRYERGVKVPRVNFPERGPHRDVIYYDIFGATVAATNVQVGDGLNTRAIQINMPDSTKNFDNEVKPEVALPLKERLTAFRARHLNDELPVIPKPPFRRLGDITRPLLQVVRLVRPEREPVLLALIAEIENEKRQALSSTLDAKIIDTLLSLDPEKLTWFEAKECFLITDLEEALNEGVPDKQKVSSKYLGGKVRALGIPFVHRQPVTKRRLYLYDRELLNRLAVHYGLVDPPKKEEQTGVYTPPEKPSQWSRQSQTVAAVGVQGGTIEDENGTMVPTVPGPSGTIDQMILNGPANGPAGSPWESKAGNQRDRRDQFSGGVYTPENDDFLSGVI